MKMLKKMAALLLAGVMAMALLTACGEEAPSKSFAQQAEETVFTVYSKVFGVEKNDAEMKQLAEKTLGYIDANGIVTVHEDMQKQEISEDGRKLTLTIAMPLPDSDSALSGNSKTYKALEITPENLNQLKIGMNQIGQMQKYYAFDKLGVAAKTINGKTYVAFAVQASATK